MKTLSLRFILGFVVLGFMAASGWAQTHAGAIKAAKVTGTVTRVDSAGAITPVVDGTMITESDAVVTAADSGVVLVFMNGSSVKVGANSRLLIAEFKMDPLQENIEIAKLTKEPSVSQTKLDLAYGDIVGDVKKLNKSSNYHIKTAVGAAGIRGTIFRVVFLPPANGQPAMFQLSTAEGLVVFTAPTGANTDVGQGSEVVATADVNTTTGAVSAVSVQSQGISPEAATVIQTAVVNAIQQAQQSSAASFTPAEQQSAGSGTGTTGGTASTGTASDNTTGTTDNTAVNTANTANTDNSSGSTTATATTQNGSTNESAGTVNRPTTPTTTIPASTPPLPTNPGQVGSPST